MSKMTADEFAAAIKKIADSNEAAAAVLGIGRRSVIRYLQKETPVPEYLRRLLTMYKKHGVPKELRQ